MPELPDVEIFRRHIAATCLRRKIECTSVRNESILAGVSAATLQRRLKGSFFECTRRHGKWLLLCLNGDGGWLALHFGMTGLARHREPGEREHDHTRICFTFEDDTCLDYVLQRMFGHVELLDDPEELVARHQLGPDALSVERGELEERLSQRRGAIKPALMDQSVLAGIGNIYSDEILFQMAVHPKLKLDGHPPPHLFEVIGHVLQTAVDRHANPDEMPESWLTPRRDEPGACPRCTTQLTKVSVGGRSAVICPSCQSLHRFLDTKRAPQPRSSS